MSSIKIIFAQSLNGIIGKDGGLPWHLTDEIKEFKKKTLGSTVAMGRKTWESLPVEYRPLPERTNIVFTRANDEDPIYQSLYKFNNVVVISSPKEYLEIVRVNNKIKTIWIIGGKSIYDIALPFASEVHVTTVMINAEGDTLAPKVSDILFRVVSQSQVKTDSKTNIPYYTTIYRRKYEL